MEYNKLNIFYLALTEKECFRLELAVVRENEPALKRKSPQTGMQA